MLPKATPTEVLTVPNAVTAVGFALAADGARQIETPRGVAEIAVGRALDLVDGAVARRTGQTSEFGAGLDAAADKAGLAVIGVQMLRHRIMPGPLLAAIGLQHATNAGLTMLAKSRHPDQDLRPVPSGKWGMALQNVAGGAYLVGNLLKDSHPRTSRVARGVGFVTGWFGFGIGIRATIQYSQRAR